MSETKDVVHVVMGNKRKFTIKFTHNSQFAWYWEALNKSAWENDTLDLMAHFLQPGWSWIDCGAWIGSTAIYAQKLGAEVTAFEPDPVAWQFLQQNMKLNPGQILASIWPWAWYNRETELPLYSQQAGNSESSIFSNKFQRGSGNIDAQPVANIQTIDIVENFDKLVPYGGKNERTIIKMDIEGGEFDVIPYLGTTDLIKTSQCIWLISLHELNITHPAIPSMALRSAKVINLLHAMADLNWYTMQLQPIDKDKFVRDVDTGSNYFQQTLVFSNQKLEPIQ